MLPFTRAKMKASIKHSDQPETWEPGHSGLVVIAMFSNTAERKD